ncbi:hypothetical protein CRUP_013232 [Coryphaenoides rupestris]|nr:hypothetical protein CRUP_013232 [Coryphaenoides rupestris]
MYRKEEVVTVTAEGGSISSPNYPNAYPRNVLLSWILVASSECRIHLEFDTRFRLEESENGVCRYDFVEVEDQSETSTISWGRWCGQKAPTSLNSRTNRLRVTLKSDDYFVAKPGFRVYYTPLVREPRTRTIVPPSLAVQGDERGWWQVEGPPPTTMRRRRRRRRRRVPRLG